MNEEELAEFLVLNSKYDDGSRFQLEKINQLINECITMEYPPIDEIDKEQKELDEEIQEMENYLEQHNDFLSNAMNYFNYTANMRKQVEERLNYIEKHFSKQLDSKLQKAFNELLETKKNHDELPGILEAIKHEQNSELKSLECELEMSKALTRDFVHKEKELQTEIQSKTEACKKVVESIDHIKELIDLCRQYENTIADLELEGLPAIREEIAQVVIEIGEVRATLTMEELNMGSLKAKYEPLTEQINFLKDEYKDFSEKVILMEQRTQALMSKKSFAEIEVDERFQDVVESEIYQHEKQKFMLLQIDHMSIVSDIKNHRAGMEEFNAKIDQLNQKIENDKVEEKISNLKSEMSKLVEKEVDKVEEGQTLKLRIEAEKKKTLEMIEDIENEILLHEDLIVEITTEMDEEIAKLIEGNKQQKQPVPGVKLGKKKILQNDEKETSPTKKARLEKEVVDTSTKSSDADNLTPVNVTYDAPTQSHVAASAPAQMETAKNDSTLPASNETKPVAKDPPKKYIPPKRFIPVEKSSNSSVDEPPPPIRHKPRRLSNPRKSVEAPKPFKPTRITYKPMFTEDENESLLDPNEMMVEESELDTSMDLDFLN